MCTRKEGKPIGDVEDPAFYSDLDNVTPGHATGVGLLFHKSVQPSAKQRAAPDIACVQAPGHLVKIDVGGQCSVAELDTSWLCECCSHN